MKGPLNYIGGKSRLASRIIQMIPEHTSYVEPFAGGAQVFFHKAPSKVEVLNDLDGELVNFYRVCQSHHEELIRYLRFMVASRQWFERLRESSPEAMTDIQRAARYLYLQKLSFGGHVRCQTYSVGVRHRKQFTPHCVQLQIERSHARMAHVQVEHSPYEVVLERFDRPSTFFYIDPPYYGVMPYRHNFEHADFAKLKDHLDDIKGKFIVSLNDVPQVRRMFRTFNITTVSSTYTVQTSGDVRHSELLIRNF